MKTRLIQVIWATLTIAALLTLGYWLYWTIDYFRALPELQSRALAAAGLSVNVFLLLCIFFSFLIFLPYFIVAQLIMLRRSQERFSLLAAIVLLAFGTSNIVPPLPAAFTEYNNIPLAFAIPTYLLNFAGWTLLPAFVSTYPDGKFIPRWSAWLAILGALLSAVWTTNPNLILNLQGIAAIAFALLVFSGYAFIVYTQVWRYRNYYSPAQKQQVKWLFGGLLGIITTIIPVIFLSPIIIDPQATPRNLIQAELIYLVAQIGFILLPISVGIAILRYRLWDIDVIIRKTLTYALVAALLAVVYFGSIVLLQRIFASMTGQTNQIITVISTLAIAALFIPLRNRIQAVIDRRFYRNNYDAQQVLADFANTVRDETDLEQLTGRLVHVVNETMQPKSVSVWLKKET